NPHDMDETQREARGIRRYPTSLTEALDALEQDEVLLGALGSARAREFIGVRHAEWSDLGRLSIAQQIAAHFRRY
ncbi:MAG: glutamine synthetase, partial [Chloroflexi bacterium]|nr:glutamine synthetase [Chloroflexota bacterium]